MKSLLASKTFWLAMAQFIVGVIVLSTTYFGSYLPAVATGAMLMIKSLIDMWLRANTTTAITGITSTNP